MNVATVQVTYDRAGPLPPSDRILMMYGGTIHQRLYLDRHYGYSDAAVTLSSAAADCIILPRGQGEPTSWA